MASEAEEVVMDGGRNRADGRMGRSSEAIRRTGSSRLRERVWAALESAKRRR